MRLIQILSILLLFTFFSGQTNAQEDKRYVIQLSTYGSWEAFVNDKDRYPAADQVWAEKVGKIIKVYLLHYNGEYDDYDLFYPGEHLDNAYSWTSKEYKGAFRRSDVKKENLKMAYEIFKEYEEKGKIPSGYSTKGGDKNINASQSGNYKIQLGVFKEQKSLDYIADNYGLSESEKKSAEKLLTYDFKKVKNVICRRYFFGNFDTKASALAKMKTLEKKANKKLVLLKG